MTETELKLMAAADLLGIETCVAQDFANVGPVFLLDMSVVVLLVGPTAGEVDFFFLLEVK